MKFEIFFDLVDFQYNDPKKIFDLIGDLGVTDMTVNSLWFRETGDKNDNRLPPLDIDGEDRVLDRPFPDGSFIKYGKRYFSCRPDRKAFGRLVPRYDDSSSDILQQVVQEARKRGIKITIAVPDDKICGDNGFSLPVDVWGNVHPAKISQKGCINNPEIRKYYSGICKQIIEKYHPDGLMLDWIEYTNYFFSDNFNCFCSDCFCKADQFGIDLKEIQKNILVSFSKFKAADNIKVFDNWTEQWNGLFAGVSDLFRFKAVSCHDFIDNIVRELTVIHPDIHLLFTCFAPPMNKGTGFDFTGLSSFRDNVEIQSKAYRFHWGLMVRWYAQQLYEINPDISLEKWIVFSKKMLEVEDSSNDFSHYCMPSPLDFGAISVETEEKKISEMRKAGLKSYRLHAYGPDGLFRQRLEYALKSGFESVSIQRYGYLSDSKLKILKEYIRG